MDPSFQWFVNAPSEDACDYIGKGIAEFRRVNQVEVEQRNMRLQQLEIGVATGKISQSDKAGYDAANNQFAQRKKALDKYDDALVVLAVLGSRLVGLTVINNADIVLAEIAVQQAFQAVGESRFFERYARLHKSIQIGVVCGMIFCAECYPMHIWRGFGAALLGDYAWGNYTEVNLTMSYLDQSVSFLKSSPRSFTLFKSIPAGMERIKPYRRASEKENNPVAWKAGKKERVAVEDARKDFSKRVEKKGFPQPLDKSFAITSWSIPFATWDSQFNINNEGHSWANVSKEQMDPGRLFHAFVIGGHLNLRDGEALVIPAGPAEILVRWLEGLHGMTFKLVPHSALNLKKIGLKSSTLKVMQTRQGGDAYAIRDPIAVQRQQSRVIARQGSTYPLPPAIGGPLSPQRSNASAGPVHSPVSSPQPEKVPASPVPPYAPPYVEDVPDDNLVNVLILQQQRRVSMPGDRKPVPQHAANLRYSSAPQYPVKVPEVTATVNEVVGMH